MNDVREIPDFPGYYATSDGNIIGRRGNILSLFVDKEGYARTTVADSSGKKFTRKASILVLLAFEGPKPTNSHQAAHLNGDTSDNRSCNLAWKTPKENQADRVLHGTDCKGSKNATSKLTEKDVLNIRLLHAQGVRTFELSKRYNVSWTAIKYVVARKTWTHV